jgi:hypothetical protein
VACHTAEELAEPVETGLVDLNAIEVRGHLVGLIDDDEIPVRLLELRLQVFAPRKLVHARDDEVSLGERVARARRLDRVAGDDVKLESELERELVLPLLDEAPRRNDQAAANVSPNHELLDEQACHDRLPGAGVVGE